jgi:hypothetical protein
MIVLKSNAHFFELKAVGMSNHSHFSMPLSFRGAVYGTLALLFSLSVPASAQIRLLPAPREVHLGTMTPLPAKIAVLVPGHDELDEFAARDLQEAVKQGAKKQAAPDTRAAEIFRVTLLRTDAVAAKTLLSHTGLTLDPAMQSEGYVMVIEPHQASIVAASSSGIFYGVQTFKQLLPFPGAERQIPTGTVRDWPSMRYRGVQDDLSRGPVPTLEFQKHQIRVFASFKANIYSPYFEHTLLYPNEPMAAPPGGALTPGEANELVDYARQYQVNILPEQEPFRPVLKYELYQCAAETPYGHVLAPGNQATFPLIKDWFTQIAAEFPSPFLHIGADETWDLGRGRTQEQVQTQGYGPVYVSFLKQIHDELAPLNRRLLFWGDIGGADPAAVAGLPKDMIAVPWNYSSTTGFDNMIEPFAKAGIETWVAPGDANWNEVFPSARTALFNIQGFVRDGQRLGSTGTINTVWNDDGEGLFNQDWYGVLFGPVAAWQQGESPIPDYQEAYGQIFHGDASGKVNEAEKELMAAQEILGNAHVHFSSDSLFWLDPWSAQGQAVSAILLPQASELRLHAERAVVLLAQVRQANPALKEQDALTAMDLGARRLDLIGMKFELAQEIADSYAKALEIQHDKSQRAVAANILGEIGGNNGRCEDLRDAFSALKAEYSQVWLDENRPYWLNNVTVRYDLEIEKWQRRGEMFEVGARDWNGGKDLPTASTLGLPGADQQVH